MLEAFSAGGINVGVLRSGEERAGRVLVFLHGIGAYGGFYAEPLSPLLGSLDAVYLPDMRGHGDSAGRRGALGGPRGVLDDIGGVIAEVRRRHPRSAVFLAGESMGGLFALAYGARRPEGLSGLVLLAPALRVAWLRQVTPATARAALADLGAPGWRVQGGWPGREVRDPGFHERCTSDPKMLQRVGPGYLLTVAAFQAGWRREARRLALPLLVLRPEADDLLDGSATDLLARKTGDVTCRHVPEAWHNMLFDPRRDEVLAAIAEWMRSR